MTRTFSPKLRRRASFCRSRSALPISLGIQYSVLMFGVVARGQPGCRCQKHPWTKITQPARRFAKSGVPGSFVTCFRYRRPSRRRTAPTRISGAVSRPRILAMFSDRVIGGRGCRPFDRLLRLRSIQPYVDFAGYVRGHRTFRTDRRAVSGMAQLSESTIKAGALFAGIGGFCVGFHRAGIKTAWAVDNDFFCNETYKENIKLVRLITEVH